MAKKKKATKSGEVAQATMPQESTEITPAVEAATAPEMEIGNGHNDRSLPARDTSETKEADQPGKTTADPAGNSREAAKTASGRVYAADPCPTMSVNLCNYSGGPAMHLLRSHRFKQMQIRFDNGQPDEKHLTMLRRSGWIDRTESEAVWTKQFDPNARWQSVDRMEQEFKSIANAIRKDKGLEPVLQGLSVA
jgi:hypothetical protein